jgi:hypothetical protein
MTNILLGVLFYLLLVCLFLVYLDVLLFEKIQDYKEEDLEPQNQEASQVFTLIQS